MSYCATGYGFVNLKNSEDSGQVSNWVKNALDASICIDIVDHDSFEFTFDGRYDEDDLFEFYREISYKISSASVSFKGEDDTLWKHDFKEGVWSESIGEIVYSDPKTVVDVNSPDNEL